MLVVCDAASHNADSMKLDSKFLDGLRVKPDKNRQREDTGPKCEWEGCDQPGVHPAPKGRGQEGQYHRFCVRHVREYNKSYNYFSGLPDEDVVEHQKSAATGHRPTWFVGVNPSARGGKSKSGARPVNGFAQPFAAQDPYGLFGPADGDKSASPRQRPLKRLERKALRQLSLDGTVTKTAIKARFKDLVKLLHPDHNKGDRSSEDKLREVIQAYNYLKKAGLA
jgi:curved DNA-binding protein CbpA